VQNSVHRNERSTGRYPINVSRIPGVYRRYVRLHRNALVNRPLCVEHRIDRTAAFVDHFTDSDGFTAFLTRHIRRVDVAPQRAAHHNPQTQLIVVPKGESEYRKVANAEIGGGSGGTGSGAPLDDGASVMSDDGEYDDDDDSDADNDSKSQRSDVESGYMNRATVAMSSTVAGK